MIAERISGDREWKGDATDGAHREAQEQRQHGCTECTVHSDCTLECHHQSNHFKNWILFIASHSKTSRHQS
jgi:hypothetical protein